MRRFLLFAPSVILGLAGALWLTFHPLVSSVRTGLVTKLIVTLVLIAVLLSGAWLLERLLPSFRYASRLLERALFPLRLSLPLAVPLAVATALGEELFFRGALLSLLGVWWQALAFGSMHPATRRGWSYSVFTFAAGLALGYATVLTGSLWPAISAHFVINLQGFLEVARRQRRSSSAAGDQGLERVPLFRNVDIPPPIKGEEASEQPASREREAPG